MKFKNLLKKRKKSQKDSNPMTASEDEGDDISSKQETASDVSSARQSHVSSIHFHIKNDEKYVTTLYITHIFFFSVNI